MDSVLRPRDIQARIRSGESPETRGRGGPDLDRQDHGLRGAGARRARLRRRAGAEGLGPAPRRGRADRPSGGGRRRAAPRPATSTRSRSSGTAGAATTAGGRSSADYLSGESARHARVRLRRGRPLRHGRRRRVAVAGRRAAAAGRVPAARLVGGSPGVASAPRPLASVDQQLPLGDDAIELVTGRPPEPLHPEDATVDLTETASTVRSAGRDARHPAPDPASGPDADWIATQASERPADAGAGACRPARTCPRSTGTADEPADGPGGNRTEGLRWPSLTDASAPTSLPTRLSAEPAPRGGGDGAHRAAGGAESPLRRSPAGHRSRAGTRSCSAPTRTPEPARRVPRVARITWRSLAGLVTDG